MRDVAPPLKLKDIIDVDALMNVQRRLSNLLNVSIVTADPDGNTVGTLDNFIPFCSLIRSSPEGARRCEANGALLSKIAFENSCAWVHDCHMGLKDCAAPVVVDGVFLGAVLGGQAFLEGEEYRRDLFDVERLAEELDLPADKLREAIAQIPIVSERRILDSLDCYGFLASYFAESGLNTIAQKKLLSESEEKIEFQRRAREAELKSIEAQINPHFLFNTLNSVARMAMFEKAPKTEEMLYSLSDLLRYNLRQREEFPSIETELDAIKKYLFIQHIRYGNRMEYYVGFADDVLAYSVPAMILQPIVENAIIHGLEPKAAGGRIYLQSYLDGDDVVILVRDTGVGIPKEKIPALLQDDYSSVRLGLFNSHSRLQAYFGKEYGITLTSELGKGATVEIRFPCFKKPLKS